MKIDNAQLAAFSAVLHTGSFEAAARQLHVTPSAISQRIKQLEERLGQVLVLRTTPCRATPAGKTLVRFTEQLTLLESEMLGQLDGTDPAGRRHRRLPVVVNADSLDSWFLGVFDAVAAETKISLDLRVEDQDHSAALLREGTVMAAVSASAVPIQGCSVVALGVMRYCAVASPTFAGRHFSTGIDANSLNVAPMLRFNRKDGLQQSFIAGFTSEPVEPPTHFVPSVHGFIEAAKRDLGWGMAPEHFALPELTAGTLVELAADRPLDVPLYWHRWRLASAVLDELTGVVRSVGRAALRPLPPDPAAET